jgi:hypothetical protein
MTTTAATWFYRTPEKRPYLLAERLRTSFWEQRFGSLWLDPVSAGPPVVMQGAIKMEWEPAQWFRLSSRPEVPALAGGVSNLLGRKPYLRYTDTDGDTVWEWWIDPKAGERRWQELQGKPAFGSPIRLGTA